MMCCQLAHADSLREICNGLACAEGKLIHLGVRTAPNKSTLSYANEHRPAALFEDLFHTSLNRFRDEQGMGARKAKFRFKNKLLSLDSTTISLCLDLFPWAKFRRARGGVKAHVLLDHDDYLPSYVLITEAKKSDVRVAQSLELNAESIVAMDRGYNDYALFGKWTERGVFFVTRLKENAAYEVLESAKGPPPRNILADELIRFSGPQAVKDCPHLLRRVVVWDAVNEREIVLFETGVVFPPRRRSTGELALGLTLWSVDPLTTETIPTDEGKLQDEPDEVDDPSEEYASDTDRLKRRLPDYISKLRGRLDAAYRQARHQAPPKDFIESIGNGYRLNADVLLLGEVKPGPAPRRLPVVLVVEDNEQWRSSISADLEQRGMRTRAVACIEAARNAVLQEPPDLISLDLELPSTEEEMARGLADATNALDFLEFLEENYPDIPVAVLTGIAFRDSVMPRVLSAGVLEVDYINKGRPDSVSRLATSLWRLWLEVLARTRILDWEPDAPVHALHFDRHTGILAAVGPPSSAKPLRATGEGITILKRLSECPNVMVPRDTLFNLVYPNTEELIEMEQKGGDPDNSFDLHVSRLRRAISQQTGIPGKEIIRGGKGGFYWLRGNVQ